jgi:hypothetical protein
MRKLPTASSRAELWRMCSSSQNDDSASDYFATCHLKTHYVATHYLAVSKFMLPNRSGLCTGHSDLCTGRASNPECY